jgi:hypothetical protein
MFEVDIGLQGDLSKDKKDAKANFAALELDGQELMQFADINADMFTDIITVDKSRQRLIIHIFDATASNYTQKVSFVVHDCRTIQNVAVGRSDKTLRLFITCEDLARKTIVKMYDRNMNDELTKAAPDKRNL